jgi:hypothetical protein
MLGLEKWSNRNLHYYKNLKNQLDAHETKAKSIQFRHNVMEKQKAKNYNNELDRIRGELSNTVLKWNSREHLIKRKLELARLGAIAVTP